MVRRPINHTKSQVCHHDDPSGKSWQISNPQQLRILDPVRFCLAMRLGSQTKAGNHHLWHSPGGSRSTPQVFRSWLLTAAAAAAANPAASSELVVRPVASYSGYPQNSATLNSQPQTQSLQFRSERLSESSDNCPDRGARPRVRWGSCWDIFRKGKVANRHVGSDWNLVDKDKFKVKLNLNAFVIAMHSIRGVLSGRSSSCRPFVRKRLEVCRALSAGNNDTHVETAGNTGSKISRRTLRSRRN